MDADHVNCPMRGDTDIEKCGGCEFLRGRGRERSSEYIDCRATAPGLLDAANPDVHWNIAGLLT